jgi:uncharacterized protein (TIGR02996 family)
MTETELLAGIAAHPGEVERWHILADWLEDQQDPRAELARLRYLLYAEPEHPERPARLARELALLAAGLAPVVPTWTNTVGMSFALVLPGTFRMGSPKSERYRKSHERSHRVTLTRPFFLGVCPVTVGEFEHFVAATNSRTEAERSGGAYGFVGGEWKQDATVTWRSPGFAQTERHPVVCVNWNDAQDMIAWLNEQEKGLVYSLPTEAQWEYACRAGTETANFLGEDDEGLDEYAWFAYHSQERTHPVATKKPNAWGLSDMHGNVWEWCADWYGDYPTGKVVDPPGASRGSYRVSRGGSWYGVAANCRSAARTYSDPDAGDTTSGFRLAVSVRGR